MANVKSKTYATKSGLVFVNVPMTPAQRERLDAMRGNMTRSEFIRSLIIKEDNKQAR
jgi:hypothetical protein